MGNCFGLHAIRCANGLWTSPNSSHVTTRKSSENGGGITRKSPQAQQNKDNPDEVSCKTPAIGAPGFMAEVGNSTNYLHAFTYSELKSATRNFRPDSLLGKGGFGSVFKGNIHERTFQTVGAGQGILIAVKKLNSDGYQGHREWLAELKYLGTLKHPNLVKLIGYCCEDEHRLLVYEFMNRGSLEHHLFGRKNQTVSWSTRLKIAVDAARGLTFLHDAEKPVIYRDFKTSNILLDSDFNAKLSDFGLAKDGPTGNKTHVTTRILGTYGYVAPEYVATGHLTAKSDVYGFGVVLLEILTGKRAVSTDKSGEEQKLVEWAMPYLTDKRKWTRVLDQSLDGQYSLKGAQHAANIALHCLSQDPRRRPTMKMVLEALEPLLNPKAEPKNSSFLLISDETKSPTTRETPSIRCPKPNPSKHAHAAASRQAQALAFHPRPANAFRLPSPLPSPQQIACKQSISSHTIAPSQSPARVSPIVQP